MGEILRDSRRTSVITLASAATGRVDAIRACDPECRNEILLDLGVPGAGSTGKAQYRGRGDAVVTVAWSGIRYRVSWKRHPPSARFCDHCGDEWPGREAPVRATREPTEAQRRVRAEFAVLYGRKAVNERLGPWGSAQDITGTPGPENAPDSRSGPS